MSRARSHEEGYASLEEVAMAFSGLTHADFGRLGQICRLHARGLAQLDWGDLLHEAVRRALDGTRRWPLDLPFTLFLRGAIRSIASEARRVQTRMPQNDGDDEVLATLASTTDDPEQAALAVDLVGSLQVLFAGDETSFGMLQGLIEGLSPAEIQARLKIGQTEYDSTRRRIRRKIAGAPEIFK